MARPKQKWTSEEEKALEKGVGAYKKGKWQAILNDPNYKSLLANRSNVDLKDKWRNLKQKLCRSSLKKRRARAPKPCRSSLKKRRASRYQAMIYESLSSVDDPNGTDVNTMVNFIEPKYVLPKNFRRSLTSNLSKLVLNGSIEKAKNRYKLKGTSSGAETSHQEDVRTNNVDETNEEQVGPQNRNKEPVEPLSVESLEDAANVAAYLVALAETKNYAVIKDCEDKKKLAHR